MSYQRLFVGIDVSKYKHDIAIVNEQKQFVGRPFVIKDDLDGYQHLIGKLDELMRQYHTQRFYIGLESTGDYWKNIYYFLKRQPQPFVVMVINPVQTRAHAKSELRLIDVRDRPSHPDRWIPNINESQRDSTLFFLSVSRR